MKNLPFGLWPVMITPFKTDNTLDLEGVQKVTDLYLAAGASGMFANCLSSEMYQLTREERLELISTVVSRCQGKVPVVATGSFYNNGKDNAAFIREVHEIGVAAVILISGVLAEPAEGEDLLKRRIEEIMAETSNIPLGLYECPVPYKRLISPDLMAWLSATGRFYYFKDTSCDNAAIRQKLHAVSGSFQLYNADTPSALQSLRDGAMGISPISGNFYPELYGHFLKLYRQQRNEELEQLNTRLTVMDLVTHQFYPWSAKIFLQKRGMDLCANTRIPMGKMTVKDQNILNALHGMMLQTMEEFGISSII